MKSKEPYSELYRNCGNCISRDDKTGTCEVRNKIHPITRVRTPMSAPAKRRGCVVFTFRNEVK